MLVQSCLDAFLAAIVEVKDSLRASPRVVFSSGPTCPSSFYKYTAETARGELTLRSTTLLHNYVST